MNRKALLAFVALLAVPVVADDLPNVLIIGDSISLGYTPHVKQLMKGTANVVHNKGNAQHTGTGLSRLDAWLGEEEWDIIHFNWGLWDLCYRHPESKVQGRRDKVRGTLTTSLKQYEKNLDQLVRRLRKTKAKLIWANTTVVPPEEAGRKVDDDLRYNEAAARVMTRYGVTTNDLNALTRTFGSDLFTQPGNVHFTPDGYRRLAAQVVSAVNRKLSNEAARSITRIGFGSCIKQAQPVPIFEAILKQDPEVFVFLGDNIYGDTDDMSVLKKKYSDLAAKPGFQTLRGNATTLSTWDDHDYGINDGGADYSMRVESEKIFEDFWRFPANAPVRGYPGVYSAWKTGPEGREVQIILLDTRYFRSPLKRGAERRTGGPYVPDDDPEKTMLGDAQWKWLEQQLRQPAELRIIASSIQFLATDAGQETWSNLPRERTRMLELIRSTGAENILFMSGDRHWSEISRLEEGMPYPLYDITSSSLNQPHGRGTPTVNDHRFSKTTVHDANFGMLLIDWGRIPRVTMQIHDVNGVVKITHSVGLHQLSAGN